jgi:MSHA biogenesis protein MshO
MKKHHQRGFTFIELVMVIVVLGVISSIVSKFMRMPVDAYISSGRRFGLTDKVDTAMRRIERDLRRSLPNSIRVSSSGQCLYLIPTKSGGRYRVNDIVSGDGKGLDFSSNDSSFNMLGDIGTFPASQQIKSGDLISVYNLGVPGADVYAGSNVTTVGSPIRDVSTTPVETTIPLSPFKFPFASGSSRFHVISSGERVVSYVCNGNSLYRIVNSSSFSDSCLAAQSDSPSIANNLGSCSFGYSTPELARNALVGVYLKMQDDSLTESVSIERSINVNNTP